MEKIIAFTDGGCRGNGKENSVGAWAYTLEHEGNEEYNYQAESNTTNNIQELKACIEALKAIKTYDIPVEMHSDSAYVINGISGWIHNWKKNDWTRGKNNDKPIMNLELWKELDELRCKFDSVEFIKVKGHSDNEGNNNVDELVNIAMDEYMENNII